MKTAKPKKRSLTLRGAQNKDVVPLSVLYEDKNLAVFDKPAGVVVSREENSTTTEFDPTKFVVHRLDKDTSGVLIVAKNRWAQKKLSKQFMERKIVKHYLALVCGHITPIHGRIEAGIGRSAVDRKKMSIFSAKMRPATTHYSVVRYVGPYTLVGVYPETGRTHQIRVHLQSIGFPIVGDPTYGNKKVNSEFREKYGLARQFLHAHRIGFELLNGENKVIESKLPKDLDKVLRGLSK